jgi:hypothetical protein
VGFSTDSRDAVMVQYREQLLWFCSPEHVVEWVTAERKRERGD